MTINAKGVSGRQIDPYTVNAEIRLISTRQSETTSTVDRQGRYYQKFQSDIPSVYCETTSMLRRLTAGIRLRRGASNSVSGFIKKAMSSSQAGPGPSSLRNLRPPSRPDMKVLDKSAFDVELPILAVKVKAEDMSRVRNQLRAQQSVQAVLSPIQAKSADEIGVCWISPRPKWWCPPKTTRNTSYSDCDSSKKVSSMTELCKRRC